MPFSFNPIKLINNFLYYLFIIILKLFCLQRTYAGTIETDPYQIYLSRSFINKSGIPSISAINSNNNAKWFDDYSTMSVSAKTEIGIINNLSGYSYSIREQSLYGSHHGTASRYTCLGFFCSWVNYALIENIDSTDSITYDLQFLQFWGEKIFKKDALELSPIIGVNLIKYNLIVKGLNNNSSYSDLFPLPIIGFKIKLILLNDFDLIYDLHYSNLINLNTSLKFVDSEFEIRNKISKFFYISFGNNTLFFNFRKSQESLNTKITTPQNSLYLKLVFLY